MRIRLVPVMIFAAAAMLTVKVDDAWQHADAAFAEIGRAATAAASATAAPTAVELSTTRSPRALPLTADVPSVKAPSTNILLANAPPASIELVAAATPTDGGTSLLDPASTGEARAKPKRPITYSPAEVEILQALSERRAKLDRQAEEIDRREALLQAAEQRVDEKIVKLQNIQKTIDGLLKKYDEQEETKVRGLVHIYEMMKPKEAARIFEQLDMPVLLEVLERMKDLKTAPILASMDPEKARTITIALAERRQLPTVKP
jgi:flagellar motility protein MotE (MotC chaperone)